MNRVMTAVLAALLLTATGCTSVANLGGNKVAIPRTVEDRSPFGTNMGFARVEVCDVKQDEDAILFTNKEYVNCLPVTGWQPMSSQGQGGQIVEGALIGGGIAGGAALLRPSTITSNATSNSISSSTATAPTSITNNITSNVQNGSIH